MLECLVDGELSSRITAADRGLQFGDGLSETITVIGGQPRFWQGHMDRIAAGCEVLGLTPPPQAILLRELQTVSAGQGDCLVRIILTRDASAEAYRHGHAQAVRRIVFSLAWPDTSGMLPTVGIRTRICDLRLAIQPALSGISHLNRLQQITARAEWSDERIEEGILLDREDHVISGISTNIFVVFGDRILTPRLDRCGVRGVMRAAILAAFRERCEQRRIGIDMLPEAAEIFVCNSLRGVIPVTRIDHWEYGIGRVTREVQEWLAGQ